MDKNIKPLHHVVPDSSQSDAQPATPAQSATPSVDRSYVQNVYPQVADVPRGTVPPPRQTDIPAQASSSGSYDVFALLSGLASSLGYLPLAHFIRSGTLLLVICAMLALVALTLAIKNYHTNGELSPYAVIGISTSTLTLVFIANALIARAYLESQISRLPF